MNEENKNKPFISNRDRGLSVAIFKKQEVNIKDELPYSAEIRAKHCEPDDEIDFGERYCTICGCVLSFDEEDICNDCLFESSRPLTGEEIKILKGQKDETR